MQTPLSHSHLSPRLQASHSRIKSEESPPSRHQASPPPLPPRSLHSLRPFLRGPKPMQILNLAQHQLQQLLPLNQIQMPSNLRILSRKPIQTPTRGHVLVELGLDLPRKTDIKVVEHLDVQEQDRGLGELGGDGVEEDFGAVVLAFEGLALAGFGGEDAHRDDVGAVAEEDGFSACGGTLLAKGA